MIDQYLRFLGLARRAPSVDYLFDLHRAHVSRVIYTNVDIRLGQPGTLDPAEAAARIVAGKGGYCFQLNSAFAWLLRELGFSVTLHRGYVFRHAATEIPSLNHLVLVVHDLDEDPWLADAGLGDAIYEPLPLAPGSYGQGPFSYSLKPAVVFDGWRFEHDVTGSFAAMEFEAAAATLADFAGAHAELSTSPESSFTQFLTAQRRLPDRVEALRCLTVTTISLAGAQSRLLETFPEWSAYLRAMGVPGNLLPTLWEPELARHQEWMASL
jgi:N-hydroxyarylamine O-acetyltransferase